MDTPNYISQIDINASLKTLVQVKPLRQNLGEGKEHNFYKEFP